LTDGDAAGVVGAVAVSVSVAGFWPETVKKTPDEAARRVLLTVLGPGRSGFGFETDKKVRVGLAASFY
jgi:hypothetical protein